MGGPKNLELHCTSKACKAKHEQKAWGQEKPKQKQDHSLFTFFGPWKALIPSTVTTPHLIQVQAAQVQTAQAVASSFGGSSVPDHDLI